MKYGGYITFMALEKGYTMVTEWMDDSLFSFLINRVWLKLIENSAIFIIGEEGMQWEKKGNLCHM